MRKIKRQFIEIKIYVFSFILEKISHEYAFLILFFLLGLGKFRL